MSAVDWSWGQRYPAPTLVMSPVLSSTAHGSMGHYANSASHFLSAPLPVPQPLGTSQWDSRAASMTITTSKASRKRSRDELADMDDDSPRSDTTPFPSATPSPPKRDAVMGPGMTLIYEDGPVVDASSQTGTWAEELAERLRTSELTRDERRRPGLESRKSIRLDRGETGMDDLAASALPGDARLTHEPRIDEASLALGIGWTTLASSDAMGAASRGWSRHIETHFPLESVKIVWRNSSIPAYLVSAATSSADGRRRCDTLDYYLFDEALAQGRFVASSWGRALQNLQTIPIAFDGEKVLESDEDEMMRHSEQNNLRHWASKHMDVPSATEAGNSKSDGMDLD